MANKACCHINKQGTLADGHQKWYYINGKNGTPPSSTLSTPLVCAGILSTGLLVSGTILLVVAKEVAGVCLEARYCKGCAWQQGWGIVFQYPGKGQVMVAW